MRDVKQEILTFWFEVHSAEHWFQKNPNFDEDIRRRFEGDYLLASDGIYDGWMNEPKSSLALIVLLDQFPRNMYRGRARMFATDDKALTVAGHAIDQGFDKGLSVDERLFMYLPYEHSENLDDQKQALELIKPLEAHNPIYYEYAKKHYEVIKKFGRFPHRNEVLERQNTRLEEEYLSQPDAGF